jgi:hypothetical protein
MLTSPKRATIGRGSRMPSARSSEYLPGPISIRALAIAVFVKGSSAPPLVAQMGFSCNGWTFAMAIAMDPVTPRGPRGLRNPRSMSMPPPNSESPAPIAQGLPGRNPRDSSQPLVPRNPYPSNQPNNFCDPWPAINEPKVARKISKARLRATSPPRLFLFLGDAKLLTAFPPSPFPGARQFVTVRRCTRINPKKYSVVRCCHQRACASVYYLHWCTGTSHRFNRYD